MTETSSRLELQEIISITLHNKLHSHKSGVWLLDHALNSNVVEIDMHE